MDRFQKCLPCQGEVRPSYSCGGQCRDESSTYFHWKKWPGMGRSGAKKLGRFTVLIYYPDYENQKVLYALCTANLDPFQFREP